MRLEHATRRLAATSDSARLDAELLLAHALGRSRAWLVAHADRVVQAGSVDQARETGEPRDFEALIERRAAGEPLAYIVGHKHFWTLKLDVTPAVLVPRPETELLVELALRFEHPAARVVDLGTGSGAVALALASERPQWRVTATDASPAALGVARRNAEAHGLNEVEFLAGHWLEPLAGRRFELIVSNPPYIAENDAALADPALLREPRGALTPGGDGLSSLCEILRQAPEHLESGGWLLLEHGATQAAEVARELVARGFRHVRSHRDLAGHERATEAHWI